MSYQGKRHYEFERSMEKASSDLEEDMLQYVAWKYPSPYVLKEARAHERVTNRPHEQMSARHAQLEAERRRAKEEADVIHYALKEIADSGELNFHGGISFRLSALETLKMVSASSIFGEPQYYRDGARAQATMCRGLSPRRQLHARACTYLLDSFKGMTTAEVMEKAIDEALDEDFGATLEWAVELREVYQMRMAPQVIIVRAAAHPGRVAWTAAHPGEFGRVCRRVMSRGDDVGNQVGYWLARHDGDKRGIPAILKRAWAASVSDMGAYSMAKYANKGIGLVNVVRICHAKGPLVDELMRQGCVQMPEGQDTWEHLRASGMGWEEILHAIRMPHMALLRNLRGIFSEVEDPKTRTLALELLKRGVVRGRQLPFRYLSAWKAVESTGEPWVAQVQDALEECMGIACANLPSLSGRSAFMTDVSGSMRYTFTSSYGTMTMMEIACLAAVAGASRAKDGIVIPFADRMERMKASTEVPMLTQSRRVVLAGWVCGSGTENPLDLLLEEALRTDEHWDNIIVYSDMQAGHAGMARRSFRGYVDRFGAPALVELYRRRVNPRLNVYCIQLAGYTKSLVPEQGYRMTNLYGWNGKELVYADAVGRMWDEADKAGHGRP